MTEKPKTQEKAKPFLEGAPTDENTVRQALKFFGAMLLVGFMCFLVCSMTSFDSAVLRIGINLVIEALILMIVFRAAIPALSRVGYNPPGKVQLNYTKRHIVLLAVLFAVGAASVTGYAIYDYNTKSFSASYTAGERLEKNKAMNAWVTEKRPELRADETVTIIESARSTVSSKEMTYELAIYKIDPEKYEAKHAEAEEAIAAGDKDVKEYNADTLNGYSKSKAAKDDTLIRIGTGTAVTDKHTMKDNSIGDRISMEISMSWDEETNP